MLDTKFAVAFSASALCPGKAGAAISFSGTASFVGIDWLTITVDKAEPSCNAVFGDGIGVMVRSSGMAGSAGVTVSGATASASATRIAAKGFAVSGKNSGPAPSGILAMGSALSPSLGGTSTWPGMKGVETLGAPIAPPSAPWPVWAVWPGCSTATNAAKGSCGASGAGSASGTGPASLGASSAKTLSISALKAPRFFAIHLSDRQDGRKPVGLVWNIQKGRDQRHDRACAIALQPRCKLRAETPPSARDMGLPHHGGPARPLLPRGARGARPVARGWCRRNWCCNSPRAAWAWSDAVCASSACRACSTPRLCDRRAVSRNCATLTGPDAGRRLSKSTAKRSCAACACCAWCCAACIQCALCAMRTKTRCACK